jgi:hypothetical protein
MYHRINKFNGIGVTLPTLKVPYQKKVEKTLPYHTLPNLIRSKIKDKNQQPQGVEAEPYQLICFFRKKGYVCAKMSKTNSLDRAPKSKVSPSESLQVADKLQIPPTSCWLAKE